jgi:predicted O-methyltransferase YrrM
MKDVVLQSMDFILSAANDYALYNSSTTDELLQEIHAHTVENHAEPHMISGPLQGNFLAMMSRMIKPKRILEIGSFTGYSALCLAKGLAENGILHTIEKREADAETAQNYFNRSAYKDQIEMHVGDAASLLPSIHEDWDLVFIDADKTGYLTYYLALIDGMKAGSFFIVDNVLFHGEVLKENITGKSAKAIAAFNAYIRQDERVEKVMLTVRDGLTILCKK